MPSYIQFSTPALRKCIHNDVTVGNSFTTVLSPRVLPERRVVVIVQNKSAVDVIEVVFDDTATTGILVQPWQSISLENYNGTVRIKSSGTSTTVHIAYASV